MVDSFAGGGGASNGIRLALQQLHGMELLPMGHPLDVDFAVNHDDAALCMHAANHPDTIHLPANVWQVSMRETLGDDLFGLLWLSPDCRDHSPAKGGPITSRAVRDLAWVAVKWLKELPDWQRPWVICLENVSAFAKWSPLIERPDGKGYMRDLDRLGWIFHQFVHALSRFGYSIGWKEVVACEYGSPTIRKRLKMVARRDGLPVEWPEPTHGAPMSDAVKEGRLKPWPVAADILDWSLDCPSIFLTKEEAREYTKRTGKRITRPLAAKTHARLAYGVKRHVLDAGDDAFVVDRSGRKATSFIKRDFGASIGTALTEPAGSVTCGGGGKMDLVELSVMSPFVSRGQHGGGNRPATHPLHTIAASDGDQNQVIVPYLVPRYGERQGQEPRSIGINRPAPTPVPDGNQGSLAAVYLAQHNNDSRRKSGVNPGRPASVPISTLTVEGAQQGVVAAHMLSLKGSDRRDGSCKAAHPAVCASGQHSAVVTLPLMTAYYSTGGQYARVDSPSLTVPTKARFGLTEADAAVQPLTEAQWARARQVAEFLRTHECWDGGDIVTVSIRGTVFVIVDIGMRMLVPRELARAQDFPDSQILDPIFKGKPLSETEQRHKIGNSVCEKPAAAVIVANYRPPLEWGAMTFREAAE
ncbi:DNA cytosine methyltransferase [Nitratireductor indicus]|uniref:DNA cytosine methyltransferase n=1 Tax=Nitratireductor indicus TaxID=721133 RepID=UPI0028763F2C|nr:DNA cytosine methyltransferase [Nitratireductor indicus]MDS1135584.1 DNA cytosine methyltransferase [Nitratireductor indicus]